MKQDLGFEWRILESTAFNVFCNKNKETNIKYTTFFGESFNYFSLVVGLLVDLVTWLSQHRWFLGVILLSLFLGVMLLSSSDNIKEC